jgi:UDP:flavonoid glycosyltransferase YjiC (YdhE family)
VVPRPRDWPSRAHVTGYWLPADEGPGQVDRALKLFIERGPPPVYIGFGSMPEGKPEELAGIVIEALRLTGCRAVVQGKWLSDHTLPADIYHAGQVPHIWLFPKCSAVVHHGGASTTAQSLRAGVPTIVVPHAWDQFFWGTRVKQLGPGPEPVSREGLTARKLSRAIETAIKNGPIRSRAVELGRKLITEHGAENAVRVICDELKTPPG